MSSKPSSTTSPSVPSGGPLPPDAKTPPRETDAPYDPNLDDGVMANSSALHPLLHPQWNKPKAWWKELTNAKGRKDYDWSHLAAKYFPTRALAKCQQDPSLGVIHGCFWKYHPERAYAWELRLQVEIEPGFTIDEPGSDQARAAFEQAHPGTVTGLRDKEAKRRERKQAKADRPTAASSSRTTDACPCPWRPPTLAHSPGPASYSACRPG